MFSDRATKMVAVNRVETKATDKVKKGGQMAVTTLKVGKKLVEREMTSKEEDEFYGTYTFNRSYTKKMDHDKRIEQVEKSRRLSEKMAKLENKLNDTKQEINDEILDLNRINDKFGVVNKLDTFSIEKELYRG
jgi:hypothetical protein